jgi:uncharacterized BrkB/YihY/UPF0761 family membrane protein
MNSSQQRQFVEELLNQMPELNSEKYQIYRKELDEKLARARNDEKSMRRIVIGAWSSSALIYAIVVVLCYRFGRSPNQFPDWFVLLLAVSVVLVPLAALLLLALYFFKYRRQVNRAQGKAQQAALGELQRQLNELRAQLRPLDENQRPSTPQK